MKNCDQYLQYLMDSVLQPIDKTIFKVHLDQILIHTENFDQHMLALNLVLLALNYANLKVGIEESEFLMTELTYLDYHLSSNGFSINQENLIKIRDYPTPTDMSTLGDFLCLIEHFRQFLPGQSFYFRMAIPLHRLLGSNRPFVWTSTEQCYFDNLKGNLIHSTAVPFRQRQYSNYPLLVIPNVQTDQS